jgi:hypothetical protein
MPEWFSRGLLMRRYIQIFAALAAAVLCFMVFHAWLVSHDEQLRLQAVIKAQSQLIESANVREHDRAIALGHTVDEIDKLKHETQSPQQVLQGLPEYLPLPQPITMERADDSARAQGRGEEQSLSRAGSVPGAEAHGSPATASNGPRLLDALAGEFEAVRGEFADHLPGGADRTNADGAQDFRTRASECGSAGVAAGSATENRARQTSIEDPLTACAGSVGPEVSPSNPSSARIPMTDLKPLYDFVQDCRACQAQLAVAKQDRLDDAEKLAALTRERDAAVIGSRGGSFWRQLRRNATWFAIGATAAICAGKAAAAATSNRHQAPMKPASELILTSGNKYYVGSGLGVRLVRVWGLG